MLFELGQNNNRKEQKQMIITKCTINLYNKLYKTQLATDYTITLRDKQFHLHKLFLVASSDFFRVLLTNDRWESEQSSIDFEGEEITDSHLSVFESVIIPYFYNVDYLEITELNFIPVVEMANYFQMTQLLKTVIEQYEIPAESVFKCLVDSMSSHGSVFASDLLLDKLLKRAERLAQYSELKGTENQKLLASFVENIDCYLITQNEFRVSYCQTILESVLNWKHRSALLCTPLHIFIKTLVQVTCNKIGPEETYDLVCYYVDNNPHAEDPDYYTDLWMSLPFARYDGPTWNNIVETRKDIPERVIKQAMEQRAKAFLTMSSSFLRRLF